MLFADTNDTIENQSNRAVEDSGSGANSSSSGNGAERNDREVVQKTVAVEMVRREIIGGAVEVV